MKLGHRKSWLHWKTAFFSIKLLLMNGVVIFQCDELALVLLTCTRSISVHVFFGPGFHSFNPSFISK